MPSGLVVILCRLWYQPLTNYLPTHILPAVIPTSVFTVNQLGVHHRSSIMRGLQLVGGSRRWCGYSRSLATWNWSSDAGCNVSELLVGRLFGCKLSLSGLCKMRCQHLSQNLQKVSKHEIDYYRPYSYIMAYFDLFCPYLSRIFSNLLSCFQSTSAWRHCDWVSSNTGQCMNVASNFQEPSAGLPVAGLLPGFCCSWGLQRGNIL